MTSILPWLSSQASYGHDPYARKNQGQRSDGSKHRLETNGWTGRRSDGHDRSHYLPVLANVVGNQLGSAKRLSPLYTRKQTRSAWHLVDGVCGFMTTTQHRVSMFVHSIIVDSSTVHVTRPCVQCSPEQRIFRLGNIPEWWRVPWRYAGMWSWLTSRLSPSSLPTTVRQNQPENLCLYTLHDFNLWSTGCAKNPGLLWSTISLVLFRVTRKWNYDNNVYFLGIQVV